MKKKNLFRLLWLPILMASVGLTLLSTQVTLPRFNWFASQTATEAHVIYSITVYETGNTTIIGWWDFYDDGTKKWRPWPGTNPKSPITTSDFYVRDLIYTKNKKRPAEKIFRA